jgi:hypothetical protein
MEEIKNEVETKLLAYLISRASPTQTYLYILIPQIGRKQSLYNNVHIIPSHNTEDVGNASKITKDLGNSSPEESGASWPQP